MPNYLVTLQDGRKLKIDADSEAAARSAGEKWLSENPRGGTTVEPQYGALESASEGLMKGVALNWRDEIRGASAASGLPEALGGFRAPIGAARLGLEALTQPAGTTGLVRQQYEAVRDETRRRAEAMQRQHPYAFGAGELGGGVVDALALPASSALTLGGRIGTGLLEGGALGAVAGAGEAETAEKIPQAGGIGALGGALVGGALPVAGEMISVPVSNLAARWNPQSYGARQVGRAIAESGQTPAAIDQALTQAAREGQDVFLPADVMGTAGQNLLSSVARAPGEGRQLATETLEQRQAGQGRRIANQLAQGFGEARTAQQAETAMTAARDAAADIAYPAARRGAGAVDLSPVIAEIDATLQPGATQIARPQSGIASDTSEAALESIRRRLTDDRSTLSDYTAVERVRHDLSDMVNSAQRAGQGNRARLLRNVLRTLDRQMEQASPGFLQANREFAQATRDIEAIAAGRSAAMRGRPEDTIPAFQALSPQGQQAFRAGYIDPLQERVGGAAFGANKAREFTSEAFAREAQAMAPGADQLQRQLARENLMFATRTRALGGSHTADNLANAEALGVDPAMITHAITGDWHGLLRGAMGSIHRGLTGNTPEVRRAIAEILLARNLPPGEFQRIMDQTVQSILRAQQAAQTISRTGAGLAGGATAGQTRDDALAR